ncbi:helix-turn-helix domain-containing protein, partial [Comamonas aquatica]
MTEVVDVSNAEQQVGGGTGTLPSSSAGQMLRQAREQRQVSLQSLAGALKVPAHKLQALEEDRWDLLTDSVFTRSLALSVCRVLQIPSAPVMAGLPKHEAAKLASNPEGINTPFKEKTLRSLMSPTQDSGSGSAVKLGVAVLIAAIGGAGLYFL